VLNILEKCDKYYLDILHQQSRIWPEATINSLLRRKNVHPKTKLPE
jgi:hypothetical protein